MLALKYLNLMDEVKDIMDKMDSAHLTYCLFIFISLTRACIDARSRYSGLDIQLPASHFTCRFFTHRAQS